MTAVKKLSGRFDALAVEVAQLKAICARQDREIARLNKLLMAQRPSVQLGSPVTMLGSHGMRGRATSHTCALAVPKGANMQAVSGQVDVTGEKVDTPPAMRDLFDCEEAVDHPGGSGSNAEMADAPGDAASGAPPETEGSTSAKGITEARETSTVEAVAPDKGFHKPDMPKNDNKRPGTDGLGAPVDLFMSLPKDLAAFAEDLVVRGVAADISAAILHLARLGMQKVKAEASCGG